MHSNILFYPKILIVIFYCDHHHRRRYLLCYHNYLNILAYIYINFVYVSSDDNIFVGIEQE